MMIKPTQLPWWYIFQINQNDVSYKKSPTFNPLNTYSYSMRQAYVFTKPIIFFLNFKVYDQFWF